ncbi:hypothetical protein ACVWYQ_003735 [Bradyrhizobium sp. USDA 3397]
MVAQSGSARRLWPRLAPAPAKGAPPEPYPRRRPQAASSALPLRTAGSSAAPLRGRPRPAARSPGSKAQPLQSHPRAHGASQASPSASDPLLPKAERRDLSEPEEAASPRAISSRNGGRFQSEWRAISFRNHGRFRAKSAACKVFFNVRDLDAAKFVSEIVGQTTSLSRVEVMRLPGKMPSSCTAATSFAFQCLLRRSTIAPGATCVGVGSLILGRPRVSTSVAHCGHALPFGQGQSG